jgi:DNA ligase D-like protein (predicted ligase)
LSKQAHGKLRKQKHPRWTSPMLATLTDEPFSDENWIYERKLDGVRCLAFRDGRKVRLLSRNKKNQNDTYPELTEAIERQKANDFIVDGEIVAFEKSVTSFSRLQGRMQIRDSDKARRTNIAVYYYLFDLLHFDGFDTPRPAQRERKALLREALHFEDPVRFAAHRNELGERFLEDACRKRWEGLIAKRADAPYVHKRSTDWLKFKCVNQQELVIGGYTEPQGERIRFGALLVGYYDDGDLRYAGKVGTGYDQQMLKQLGDRLSSLRRNSSPFADAVHQKGIHWVTPKLVAEVGFTEWTVACGIRAISGCAATSERRRSFANDRRGEHGKQAKLRLPFVRDFQRGQNVLPRPSTHQGRPDRLLRTGIGHHAAARTGPDRGDGALPGRCRRKELFPEGRARLFPFLDRVRRGQERRRHAPPANHRERRDAGVSRQPGLHRDPRLAKPCR